LDYIYVDGKTFIVGYKSPAIVWSKELLIIHDSFSSNFKFQISPGSMDIFSFVIAKNNKGVDDISIRVKFIPADRVVSLQKINRRESISLASNVTVDLATVDDHYFSILYEKRTLKVTIDGNLMESKVIDIAHIFDSPTAYIGFIASEFPSLTTKRATYTPEVLSYHLGIHL